MALTSANHLAPPGEEDFVFWVKNQKSDKVKASEQTNILKESSRQTLEEEFVPSLGVLLL